MLPPQRGIASELIWPIIHPTSSGAYSASRRGSGPRRQRLCQRLATLAAPRRLHAAPSAGATHAGPDGNARTVLSDPQAPPVGLRWAPRRLRRARPPCMSTCHNRHRQPGILHSACIPKGGMEPARLPVGTAREGRAGQARRVPAAPKREQPLCRYRPSRPLHTCLRPACHAPHAPLFMLGGGNHVDQGLGKPAPGPQANLASGPIATRWQLTRDTSPAPQCLPLEWPWGPASLLSSAIASQEDV